MANVAGKISLKIMTIAIGIPVGIAMKKAADAVWAKARPDTPRKPSEAGVRWTDAVAWAALSAAAVAAADVIAHRSAESTYRAVLGTEPPVKQPKTAEAKA